MEHSVRTEGGGMKGNLVKHFGILQNIVACVPQDLSD